MTTFDASLDAIAALANASTQITTLIARTEHERTLLQRQIDAADKDAKRTGWCTNCTT